MITINGEASGEETEKSAVLWIILTIITFGIAGLYVLYLLPAIRHTTIEGNRASYSKHSRP